MSTLSLVTYCHRQNLSQDLSFPLSTTSKEGIQVVVKGAVKYPGVYYFKESVLMQDILNLAEPLDSADLRRYQSHVRVKKNRLITIPEKAMITIHIKGAVKEITTLKLQKGTKLQDLLTLVDFEEAANLKFLQKKRPLIDQETLDIPYKKRP